MPKTRLPHLSFERPKRGKVKWYFRIGKGQRIRLPGDYGSDEFMAAYSAALSGAPVRKPGERHAGGSLGWLIAQYRMSSAWSALAPATRRQRELIYEKVIEKAGGAPFADITARHIRQGREDRQATPFMANNFLKAMRGLFGWAVEAEHLEQNPANRVDFLPTQTEGHEPWSMADVARYEARWPEGSRERVWLHVLLYTGFRLGDACRVGWQHLSNGWVRITAEKTERSTGIEVQIPAAAQLVATLQRGPTSDLAWVSNSYGQPFTKESFGNAFRDACRAAGISGKSAHGLRKTLASHAAETGASTEELKAFFGWTSNRMPDLYTKKANRKKMAGRAAERMQAEQIGTEISPRTVRISPRKNKTK